MRKLFLMALLPILVLIGTSSGNMVEAQNSSVSIGTGTSQQYTLPFNNFYRNSFSQMTYCKSEIGQSGYIGALVYQNSSTGSTTFSELTIWLAHTPDSVVTSTTSWIPQDSLRQVFHATNYTIPSGTGDLIIPLDSMFWYDGTHHLAVVVSHRATDYSSAVQFKYTPTSHNSCLYVQNDSDVTTADYPNSRVGTMTTYRPNITLMMSEDGEFCFPVSNISVLGVTESSISVEWLHGTNPNPFDVAIMDTLIDGSDLSTASVTVSTDDSYTFTDLESNRLYMISIRQQCTSSSSEWKSIFVRTTPEPMELPFVCDFETEDSRQLWNLNNGSQVNRWTIDTLARYGEESVYGMYITNDTLNTYEYSISSAAGNVFASCLLNFDAGEYNISFDWKGMGEGTWDYMRAMLVPATSMGIMVPGSTVPSGVGPSTLPAGVIALDGGSKLNLSANWQHYMNVVNIDNESNYYLVFMWRNDGGGGSNPPIAVDNIRLEAVTCPSVDSVVVDNITSTSVTLNIYSTSGTNFDLFYAPSGVDSYDSISINTTPYTLNNLMPGTAYHGYIRSNCGDEGVSYRATEFDFGTECADITLPWAFGFECSFIKDGVGNEAHPYCWEVLNGESTSYYWYNNTARSNVHTGETGIFFSGTSTTTIYHDDWLFTPVITFTGNDEMSFWVRTTTSNTSAAYYGRFAIYASTDDATGIKDTAHYELVNITGNSVSQNYVTFAGNTWQQLTIQFPHTLVGDHHIAFVVKEQNTYSFSLDDIYIYPVSSCPTPTNVKVNKLTSTSANLSWTSDASSFIVYYGHPNFDMATANSQIVTENSALLENLTPNTTYEYMVVATCADNTSSTPTYPEYFTTACTPIENDALPLVEDFSDNAVGSANPLDDCWVRGTNYTSVYPYVNGSEGNGNPNSLYFYGNATCYCYVALPAFAEDISNLMLSCSVRRHTSSSYTSALVLGLMGNPYDITTFVPYDTLAPTELGEWSDYQRSLGDFNSEDGLYITFLMPEGQVDYSYLDNIQITLRGACDSPADPIVEAVTATTATVSWTDTIASDWAVYYGLPGFSMDTVTDPIMTSTTTATITDLNPQTTYEFKVLSNCGDGSYSAPSLSVLFTTACAPISVLPYLEDFESYSSGSSFDISPCWTKHAMGTTTQYPYPSSSAAVHGTRGLYFKSYEYGTTKYNCYAALPMFESDIDNLKLKFDMESHKGTSSSYLYSSMVAVGVMTNPNDISTFDTLAIFDMSAYPSGTVHTYEYMFNTYEGEGRYIALLALNVPRGTHSDSDNTFYIDDVEVDVIPACHRPSHFEAEVAATTANLSWTGNAQSYEVKYATHSDMSDSTVVTTATNSISLTGLTAYTTYYIDVRGVCGTDSYSEWMTMPAVIRTAMDCGDGYQNFIDTIGDGVSVTNTCVINGSTGYIESTNWTIFTAEELTAMGLVSNDNRIHSISVQVEDAGTPLALRVYMAETDVDEFSINFSDTIPLSQMTMVYDHTLTLTADSWNEIMLDTPFNYSDTMNLMIAFERTNSISSATYMYYHNNQVYRTAYEYTNTNGSSFTYRSMYRGNMIFNVCGEVPNCVRPSNVANTNISATSIDLTWQGTASQYQVAYNTERAIPADLANNAILVTANQATIQNLTPQTTYYIYVRSICGTDTSIWTSPLIRTTPCSAIDLPYSEDFDSYPATTTVPAGQTLDPCWTKGTNYSSEYPFVYTTNANSLPNSLSFYSTVTYYSYAALPAFTTPINNITMTFQLHKTSASYGKIYVGVMSDPSDINTFQRVAAVQPTENYIWEGFEVAFTNYTGNGQYIAFMLPDSITSYAQIDDIEVFVTPTCQSPTNVTVPIGSITTTSATVQWTDRAINPSAGYEIEYGPQGFELGTGTRISATTNPVTLTNLSASACYDVYVRAKCSASDVSNWSFPATFYTECGPMSLPVYYDFEREETGSSNTPHCFFRFNDGTTTYPYISSSTYDSHQGMKYIYYYASSSSVVNHQAMIFPEIDTVNYPMNNVQISFWAKRGTSPANLIVGVMSSRTSASSFVALDTIALTSTYTEYTVPFAAYTGTGVYPAIMLKNSPTLTQYAYVDDVIIEEMPVCPRVFDIRAIGATNTTATLGWIDTANTTQWIIDYRADGASTTQTITANTNPYTLTGLSPVTKYFFNVRPICSTGDTSSPVRHDASFWTTQLPATVPYTYNFEDATEWNNWQTNSNCEINWYRGDDVASQGTYAMYVSSDNGATRSSDWGKIVNAVAYRDIDFGPDTSSFTLTFKASVGGTIEHNYDAISILLVDPTEEVTATSASITSPWGHVNDVSLTSIRRDTNWVTYNVHFERIAGVQRVVFYWFNQATGSNHPFIDKAGAVDEITIQEQTCLRPYDLSATDLETTSATLTWRGNAPSYEVAYRDMNADPSTTTYEIVQGNSLALTNLTPITHYGFQVRSICGNGDTSFWSGIGRFATICDRFIASDTIREDFTSVPDAIYNATDGVMPDCWESYSNGINGVKPHVIGSGSYWYAHNGKSLVMTAGNENYGSQVTVRLPYTVEPVNLLTLSFWMCTESTTNGFLEIGYLTGPSLANDFVALKTIPASNATQYASTTGNQPVGSGIYDTVSFATAPDEAQVLAFRWNYNTSFYSVCLDDIVVTADITCPAPVITSKVANHESVALTWNGSATNYQLLYKAASAIDWSDTIAVAGNNYTINGLLPETAYNVKVRALCGAQDGNSIWTEEEFTTSNLPCFTPTNLAATHVDYEAVTLNWEANENAQRWVVNVFNTTTNIIDTVSAHPTTIDGLYAGIEYKASVKSLCSELISSEWSDTISFTTKVCPTVTNVAISNITENSAKVSWTAGGTETQWQINYGLKDFGQGEGEIVDASSNTYTITGLSPKTSYDVYVRAMCTDQFSSVWSEVVRFKTLESHEGIDGIDGNFQFAIYPNPASGSTTISLQGVAGKVTISVVDMNGRTLTSENLDCGGDCEKRIQVDHLSQGTYFVRVLGDNINSVRKLIIK